ncbi:LuxR family transcriptional regulator [Nocardioides coralli]|uniref:LuxR family transcriptional regulator n=1 Tax=Nocardioides coralli TaxID=2872154 RepID=UPI001CA39401|nr:LuxR family transcriptional regulator [Nocardioides coralli]QZY29733.1 LuxR C-terminal-related transcriptional regulator [Nocardioides coralli]
MTGSRDAARADRLAAGWRHLAAAEWDSARAAFAGSLGDDPGTHEGLSWAAWWLDDADTVFAAREAAYRLYLTRQSPVDAARMATWLAADEVDFRGATAVAQGWLRRAHQHLHGLPDVPEHGWLAFQEGYLARIVGDTGRALELATRAAEVGRDLGVPDLEVLGLALRGAVLVSEADVEEGMGCLDEATAAALAGETTIPISGAWACCFLVGSCNAVRDFERAGQWCERIEELAERYGSRYLLATCRAEYGAVYLWQGRWRDAETMLEGSVEDFGRSRPGMVGRPIEGLAELRRRQGRADDARSLLERAGGSTPAWLTRARLALDEGRPGRAVELAERHLRGTSERSRLTRAPAYELLVRARVASGDLAGARDALGSLQEVSRLIGTEPVLAAADAARGVVDAAAGEHESGRRLLEDAVDRFDRLGAPYEAAVARLDLATTLTALGRGHEAHREAEAACAVLVGLGAEAEARRARDLLGRTGAEREEGLTPREQEVLSLVAEGLANRDVAERLGISEHTVHRHVTNLLRKLGLTSRTAAAAHWLQRDTGRG